MREEKDGSLIRLYFENGSRCLRAAWKRWRDLTCNDSESLVLKCFDDQFHNVRNVNVTHVKKKNYSLDSIIITQNADDKATDHEFDYH